MNRIKIVLFALALMLTANLVRAEVSGGLFHSHFSTNGVVFSGAGTLYAVHLPTAGAIIDYVTMVDTVAYGNPNITQFNSTQTITPQLGFQSTGTIQGATGFYSFMPNGIRVNNGLFIYFSAPGNRASVYWRRDRQ